MLMLCIDTDAPTCPRRCMGWLIRFIHNRDLAAENIVTAYVRQRFVLAAPAEVLASLHAKLESSSMTLPLNSLLAQAKNISQSKGSLAGDFVVEVPRNARREREVDLSSSSYSPDLAKSARELFRTFDLGRPQLSKAIALGDVVRINGRPYRHGDYCEFAFHVRRTMSGRAGSTAYRGIGLIKAFYSVNTGHASNPTSHTLVNIIELPAEMHSTGMHLLRLDEDGGSGGSDRMIHIDNIVFKLHRVPQPLEPGVEDDGGRFYCLRIWEAR